MKYTYRKQEEGQKIILNTLGIPCSKLNYIEKIQSLYSGSHYFLELESASITPPMRTDYYHKSIDPDDLARDTLFESKEWGKNNVETVNFIQDILNKNEVNSVLDFGCGPGWLLRSLNGNFQKVGIENSKLARMQAEKYFDVYPSISNISFKFDLIIINHVIEHLVNPIETMINLCKLLAPNGRLIVGTPNFASAMAVLFKEKYRMLNEPSHISLFSLDSILRLLRDLGLQIESVAEPFFEGPYYTKENLLKIDGSLKVSPPFFGNFILISARKIPLTDS
jgi:2-polyprenyl-3-methyl-5-hydroxy-6-metoxy-1,4-benzoquinol methylase